MGPAQIGCQLRVRGGAIRARFEDLKELHGRRGLREEDYHVFAEELLASLRYFIGPQWSEEQSSTWFAAIDVAVRAMGGASSDAAVA